MTLKEGLEELRKRQLVLNELLKEIVMVNDETTTILRELADISNQLRDKVGE